MLQPFYVLVQFHHLVVQIFHSELFIEIKLTHSSVRILFCRLSLVALILKIHITIFDEVLSELPHALRIFRLRSVSQYAGASAWLGHLLLGAQLSLRVYFRGIKIVCTGFITIRIQTTLGRMLCTFFCLELLPCISLEMQSTNLLFLYESQRSLILQSFRYIQRNLQQFQSYTSHNLSDHLSLCSTYGYFFEMVYLKGLVGLQIQVKQMLNKKKLYTSSSQEEDQQDNYIPKNILPKSAVFQFKSSTAPIIEDKNQELDVSKEQDDQEDMNTLQPKLKNYKETITTNSSNVYLKNAVSEAKLSQKQLTAAYTFKYKSPVVSRKKKSDPVSLFQQTSTLWKKDKFLTSRGNNKEGRKLELEKRNKDGKILA